MSNQERSNWTPKQPEPVAPVKEFNSDLTLAEARIEQLEKVVKEIIAECYSCQYTTYWKVLDIIKEVVGETGSPKEPKAEPGLVSYEIFKFHDEWTVKHPDYVNKLALNQAVGRTDFLRIDCKNGGRYYSLIAFANENPPVKCWFRETK